MEIEKYKPQGEVVVRKFRTTTQHGAIQGKTQEHEPTEQAYYASLKVLEKSTKKK